MNEREASSKPCVCPRLETGFLRRPTVRLGFTDGCDDAGTKIIHFPENLVCVVHTPRDKCTPSSHVCRVGSAVWDFVAGFAGVHPESTLLFSRCPLSTVDPRRVLWNVVITPRGGTESAQCTQMFGQTSVEEAEAQGALRKVTDHELQLGVTCKISVGEPTGRLLAPNSHCPGHPISPYLMVQFFFFFFCSKIVPGGSYFFLSFFLARTLPQRHQPAYGRSPGSHTPSHAHRASLNTTHTPHTNIY